MMLIELTGSMIELTFSCFSYGSFLPQYLLIEAFCPNICPYIVCLLFCTWINPWHAWSFEGDGTLPLFFGFLLVTVNEVYVYGY
jgi:hypothetical protein